MKIPYMITVSRFAICLLIGATVLSPIMVSAQDSADRQFGAISRLIEKADQTLEDGNWQHAARLYGATIAAYRDFSGRFPKYESELVQFRVSYCRQQLMNILAQKRARERAEQTPDTSSATSNIVHAISKSATLCKEGNFADAKAIITSLGNDAAETPDVLLIHATINLGLGKLDIARSQLEDLLAIDEDNGVAHYNLVQLMLREPVPDYAASRQHYLEARRLGIPSDSDLEAVLDL